MLFYHATTKTLDIGQTLSGSSGTNYYPNATTLLDKSCPFGAHTRSGSLFTSDSDEFCIYFLMNQHGGINRSNVNLYEVIPESPTKCPVAITHQLESRILSGGNTSDLVDEYWKPVKNWNYYEYLTNLFTIKNVAQSPNLNDIKIIQLYGNDTSLAESL